MKAKHVRVLLPLLAVAALATACQPRRPADVREPGIPPIAEPPPHLVEFVSPEHGIRLSYPAELRPADPPEEGFILWLIPAVPGAERDELVVSVDVPKLPPHIPGLIPLGSVVRGYLEDLKEKHPDVTWTEPASMKVAGASARVVRSAWDEPDGTSRVEEAVLTVHGDRVYIFRGNQRVHDESVELALPLLHQVVSSVRWE